MIKAEHRTGFLKDLAPFPCLGITSYGLIVLLSGIGDADYPSLEGVVVVADGNEHTFSIGHHSTTWNRDAFYPMTGEVILKNA